MLVVHGGREVLIAIYVSKVLELGRIGWKVGDVVVTILGYVGDWTVSVTVLVHII